jgi:hypothetical protein
MFAQASGNGNSNQTFASSHERLTIAVQTAWLAAG